jgi:hypothetical protein
MHYLTCLELRNRIYGFILAQNPRDRVWMERKHARKRRRNIPVYRWDTARPYMGLTQACQTLRYEFRPLYMSTLRWSMNMKSLPTVLDIFGPPDMKRHLQQILEDLKQKPLFPTGFDLFELIRIAQEYQEKVKLRSGWTSEDDPVSVAGYVTVWWLALRPDDASTLNEITDMRVLLRPVVEQSPVEKSTLDTVLRLTIPARGTSEQNVSMADAFGKLFMKILHVSVVFEHLIVEVECGNRRKSWKIDRGAWPRRSEITAPDES